MPKSSSRRNGTSDSELSDDSRSQENISTSSNDGNARKIRRVSRHQPARPATKIDFESTERTDNDDDESAMNKRTTKSSGVNEVDNDNDDLLMTDSELETDHDEDDTAANVLKIEKILGRRFHKLPAKIEREISIEADSSEPLEQFLVKLSGYSYLHCAWVDRSELEKNKLVSAKIARFNQMEQTSLDQPSGEDDEEDLGNSDSGRYFPSEYVTVDRIFAHELCGTENSGTREKLSIDDPESTWSKYSFMVKWMLQGYEEATWEDWKFLETNLPELDNCKSQIRRYLQFIDPPTSPSSVPISKFVPGKKKKARQGRQPAAAKSALDSFPTLIFPDGLSLRDYQIDGIKWMSFNWAQNRNSILADEMGLGKTVQIAAFISHLFKNENVRGPFLVVAPLSTLQHWRRESELWIDQLNTIVYHGGASARSVIRDYEFKYDRKSVYKPYKFDIVITSYEMAICDSKVLSRIKWDLLVIDESHRLKNMESKLFKELVRFKRSHCIMLTGTPVQNSIEELWVLLHFLDTETFPTLAAFQETCGDLKEKKDIDALHSVLKPYFLRRMKGDVEKDLPDRQEIVIDVEMTMLQKRLYKAIYEKNTEFLFQKSSTPSLLNIGMQLRKCCNHPYLIRGVEDDQVPENVSDHDRMNLLVNASGKFVLLDKLLPKLKSEGHRVLIFSQMVRMLDIMEDYINSRSLPYERIDGNIRGADRQQAIDSFTKNPNIFLFLIATRAGGVGINLTAADTVIIFDSDWNPQNDLQAQARCHRIGQKQAVKVYRLITKNTYEMAMFNRASIKLGLDQAVLHPMTTSSRGPTERLSKKDIENLLKNGAYSIIEEKSDEKSKQFCEQDIDDILANSSRLIQYSTNPSMVGSSFAKASFVVADDAGAALDIDDPDFWEKVGFKYEAAEKANDLIIYESRKRRRVQLFNGYSGLDTGKLANKEDEEYSAQQSDTNSRSDDSDIEAQASPVAQPALTSPNSLWSAFDRDNMITALTLFGYGRWTVIREYMRKKEAQSMSLTYMPVDSRSISDLISFSLGFISVCLSNEPGIVNGSAAKVRNASSPIRHLISSETLAANIRDLLLQKEIDWLPPAPLLSSTDLRKHVERGISQVPLDPTFAIPTFLRSLIKKVRGWLLCLDRMAILLLTIEKISGPIESSEPDFNVIAELASQKLNISTPLPLWSPADDAALLQGAFQFGQANWSAINECPTLPLYGRLKPLPSAIPGLEMEYPAPKYLLQRLRGLITNLGRHLFRPTPVILAAPNTAPHTFMQAMYAPHFQPGPFINRDVQYQAPLHDDCYISDMVPFTAMPMSDSQQCQYIQPNQVSFQVNYTGIAPLQFSAEYRSLSGTTEDLLHSYPGSLMDVLHKSHYLNAEFLRKENESRSLSANFQILKGPLDALGDNARDLAILFRRVRRRTNKILHIRQVIGLWADTHVDSHPNEIELPEDLAEKRATENDLFSKVNECLESVSRLTVRNSLILSRLEQIASNGGF